MIPLSALLHMDIQRVRALWTDRFELTESKTGEHFIGPIVTAPARSVPEGVAKYLLIDGQQRITTLFILLAALRDQANALKLETLGPEIDATLLKNPFKQGGQDRFKLLPTEGDRLWISSKTDRIGD